MDVYNGGPAQARITIRCPEMREVGISIKPGELKRVRTKWLDPSSKVAFDFENGGGLIFDNLAYRME